MTKRAADGFTAAETAALRGVGAYKDEAPNRAHDDPLMKSEAQYIALLQESISTAQAAKLLRVDVDRVRQKLRDRSLCRAVEPA